VALIRTVGLTKYYQMGSSVVHALDGVDLVVERGEFVAITGASGSGKSTMMHLLGCLDRPTAGQYFLDGRNVAELSDRELAAIRNRHIGFVFQTFNLINRTTALENVSVPLFYARRTNSREPSRRALERVGLGDRVNHRPNELSGGERQRVAIARAIVNDPILVLADEPTGNLDSRTGEQIMEIFRSLNEQGVTIVLVTHEPDVALQARRVVYMRDGKIVSDKPVSELIAGQAALPGTQAAVWRTSLTHGGASAPDQASAVAKPVAAAVGSTPEPAGEPGAAPAQRAVPANEPAGQAPDAREPQPIARMMSGATGSLAAGVAALVLLATFFICGMLAARSGYDPKRMGPDQPPPVGLIVLGLVSLASLLTSIIAGAVAIVWGRGVRRRIRNTPGRWLGARRALAGVICGAIAVAVPLVMFAISLARLLLKHSGTES